MIATAAPGIQTPLLYPNLPYDPIRPLEPVTVTDTASIILAARKDSAVNDVASLIAVAKARPQGLTFGSWGKSSSGHLFGELMKLKTGSNLIHVPYRGHRAELNDAFHGTL